MSEGRTTWATVPYRDKPELTCSIIGQLSEQEGLDHLLLLNHASTPETDALVQEACVRSHLDISMECFPIETTLTQMWNRSWDVALEEGVDTLAILNNDIIILPGFIAALESALWRDERRWAVCPEYAKVNTSGMHPTGYVQDVVGSFRHGGMCGWAFLVKVGARNEGLPPIDPNTHWWANDDDLAFSIEAAGHTIGLVAGVPIDHLRSATFYNSGLSTIGYQDLDYIVKKWGR
jgi:hypothetical protein